MQARRRKIEALFTKAYEDDAGGKLTDTRFMMVAKRFDEEQEALKKKMAAYQRELEKAEKHKQSAARFFHGCGNAPTSMN